MANKYHKNAVLVALNAKVAEFKKIEERDKAKYAKEYEKWRATVADKFLAALATSTPEKPFYAGSFGPPNRGYSAAWHQISPLEKQIRLIELMVPDKNGNIVLSLQTEVGQWL